MPHGTNANKFEVAQAVADLIADAKPGQKLTLHIQVKALEHCDWQLEPVVFVTTPTTPDDNWLKRKFQQVEQEFTADEVAAIEIIAERIANDRVKRALTGFDSGLAIQTRPEDGD